MAPSAATGATGLERLLLIFLMKSWRITESDEQHLLQRRLIQQSTGQKFAETSKNLKNTANLHRDSQLHQKPTLLPQESKRATELISHRLKLAPTAKTSPPRIKTRTNGGKRETTEQNLDEQRTMVAPAHNHTETAETSKNSRCGWEQVLHGPTVGA